MLKLAFGNRLLRPGEHVAVTMGINPDENVAIGDLVGTDIHRFARIGREPLHTLDRDLQRLECLCDGPAVLFEIRIG